MAGNTRGKLKEQIAGIHNNCNWIITHTDRSLVLIKDVKPELSKGIKSLAKIAKELDKFTQDIYSRI